jgi:hypothetical protein
MKALAYFSIMRQTRSAIALRMNPHLPDELYFQANVVAFEAGLTEDRPSLTSSCFAVRSPSAHPSLSSLLEVIRRGGWLEVYDNFVSLTPNQYRIRLVRHYDGSDLDHCEFLYLAPTWGEWPLTSFCGRKGERWIGDVRRVGFHSKQGWAQPIGYIDGLRNYFVSQKILDDLIKARVVGLCVHELLWDKPELARGKFWEIDSHIVMPPCLLPVSEIDETRFYAEGAYEPPELAFLGKDVYKLGTFDIARCAENLAQPRKPNRGSTVFVVSQRFRQTLKKLGLLPDVRMYPVRLV